MKVKVTPIPGLILLEPDVFPDSRGYFFESYNREKYLSLGITELFVQDNESLSFRGVIRGLHYQLEPAAQTKLVRVISGTVFDVAVDLRKNSPAYGHWFGVELSGENKLQMLIPKGFAHGLSVLSPSALFAYKCDQLYNRTLERSIRFDDPELDIDWKIPVADRIVSEKDRSAPFFAKADKNFDF
ncbi:MAG TPA: dTDP-4-dehydrorhamnose 3,5-epimerase [Prolixibacteraceae bacterium]|nr:dTDP-4-dehydrorhamnose 3,5-epimerase [Prolixibacteraceae bacterium]